MTTQEEEAMREAFENWRASKYIDGGSSGSELLYWIQEAIKKFDAVYKCFHCGDTFVTHTEAKLHFGESHSIAEPACLIKSEKGLIKYIRQLEARLSRYQEEDSDVLRQIAEQRCEQANAIEAAEVLGYERGLKAIRNEPSTRESKEQA